MHLLHSFICLFVCFQKANKQNEIFVCLFSVWTTVGFSDGWRSAEIWQQAIILSLCPRPLAGEFLYLIHNLFVFIFHISRDRPHQNIFSKENFKLSKIFNTFSHWHCSLPMWETFLGTVYLKQVRDNLKDKNYPQKYKILFSLHTGTW